MSTNQNWHGTTIILIRKDNDVVVAGDGQVSLGNTIIKRTAKKENVEVLRITSGLKKTENSLKVLENAVINIEKGTSIKNRLSCKYCKFHKTEHCK